MSGEMEKIRKKLDEFEEKMTHTRVTSGGLRSSASAS
jgi:tetrahydromethanopterin S-methyltransferase subunit G